MKSEIIQSLTDNFEAHAKRTDSGIEFWLARDLQHLLGYEKWDNFLNVISKAKIACEVSSNEASDHFADVGKTIQMPKGAEKRVDDIMLTRYASYLIAQNGDPRKEQIAFAQTYFAVQTRKYQIIEKRLLDSERISARKKLADTEKELSKVIFEQTGSDKNFALIRSKGDSALFNHSTQQMKEKWEVPPNKALADFAPTIILKAKDFATEITIFNAKDKKMSSEKTISKEHITNNQTIRKTLIERGITPEDLPPEEDAQKVERKLTSENKKSFKNPSSLDK
ncbi:MAG: DNA damage-inducible protein D [Candidatus Caenarcaniphilales bacterium]|nr:DNA damage-inducible protein D [Candidatus Caenarcaniphilales bacterium]